MNSEREGAAVIPSLIRATTSLARLFNIGHRGNSRFTRAKTLGARAALPQNFSYFSAHHRNNDSCWWEDRPKPP